MQLNIPHTKDIWSNLSTEKTYYPGSKSLHSYNDHPAIVEYQITSAVNADGQSVPQRGPVTAKHWYINGAIGRENDRHTSEFYDKDGKLVEQRWCNHEGQRHRNNDLPAVIRSHGTENVKVWYQYDQLHRIGEPALIGDQGSEMWFVNNKLHRIGDKPAVTVNVIINGKSIVEQQWRILGDAHRLEGPAILRSNGDKEYWVGGRQVNDVQFMAICAKVETDDPIEQFKISQKTGFSIDPNLYSRHRGVDF